MEGKKDEVIRVGEKSGSTISRDFQEIWASYIFSDMKMLLLGASLLVLLTNDITDLIYDYEWLSDSYRQFVGTV